MEKEFLKGTLIYTMSEMLMKGINILLIPILTYYIIPSEYGVLGLFIPLYQTLGVIYTLGFKITQMKKMTKDTSENELGKFFFSSNIIILLFFILSLTIFLNPFSLDFLEGVFPSEFRILYFVMAILLSGIATFSSMALNYYQMKKEYLKIASYNFLAFIVNVTLSLYLVVVLKQGVNGRIIGITGGNIVLFLLFYFTYIKEMKIDFEGKYFREVWYVGIPMIISQLNNVVISYSDRILIGKFLSLEKVGIYTVAYTVNIIFSVLTLSYCNSATPFVYQHLKNKEVNNIQKKRDLLCYVLCVLAFIGMFFSREVVSIFFDEKYAGVTEILIYLFPTLSLIGIKKYYELIFLYEKDAKNITFINVVGAVINLFINLLFLKKYGINIAVYSTFISFLVMVIAQEILIKMKYKLLFKSIKLILIYLVLFNPYFFSISLNGNIWIKLFFSVIVLLLLFIKNFDLKKIRKWNKN